MEVVVNYNAKKLTLSLKKENLVETLDGKRIIQIFMKHGNLDDISTFLNKHKNDYSLLENAMNNFGNHFTGGMYRDPTSFTYQETDFQRSIDEKYTGSSNNMEVYRIDPEQVINLYLELRESGYSHDVLFG